jgi:hypothetical protein
MDSQETNAEWFQDNEPEIDFNELNKAVNIARYTNNVRINMIN